MTRLLMTADAVGGVWQYATELAMALVPFGIETVIALLGPDVPAASTADAPYQLIHTGLPLDWLVQAPEPAIAAGAAIAALADEVGADIVQLNSPVLAARAEFAVPIVVVDHGCVGTWWDAARDTDPPASLAWNVALTREGLAAADAVVAPSAAFAARMRRIYDLPSCPIVVHNGRTPLALPTDAPSRDAVFTAGRLWDEVKDAALLDRVAAAIDVPLRAAGPTTGPHGEAMTLRHATPLGRIGEAALARELAGRPIYVSAARFEPFGLSVLEAAAAGCPLVLSAIDSFIELWTGAALFVEPGDEAGFVAAIEQIRADATLRTALGEAARLRAAWYTPRAMAEGMMAIYAGLDAQPMRSVAA